MSAASSKLFSPIQIGNSLLKHRVVLAPLTRFKATKSDHVPVVHLVKEHYAQRASVPGTLLITEGTFIAPQAGGYAYVPGIWSSEQIAAWKQIADAVHAKRSFIYLQLWALGRAANPSVLEAEGNYPFVAPSPIALSNPGRSDRPNKTPRALTLQEIDEYVSWYARAARNAIEAGFDGVEIHGANGYLPDQFLQDVSNHRTDEYGGSIENRSRLGLRIVDAVTKAIGQERTGYRLNPWGRYQDMGMEDPKPQFRHFASELVKNYPNMAYLHVVLPLDGVDRTNRSIDFLRDVWAPRPFISTGLYTREEAIQAADAKGDVVGFGRWFISTPDLPFRLQHDIAPNPLNSDTIYKKPDQPNPEAGYIDYPFSKEFLKTQRPAEL